jgi:hypothetical protein
MPRKKPVPLSVCKVGAVRTMGLEIIEASSELSVAEADRAEILRVVSNHSSTKILTSESQSKLVDHIVVAAGHTRMEPLARMCKQNTKKDALRRENFSTSVINIWQEMQLPTKINDNENGQSDLVNFNDKLMGALGFFWGNEAVASNKRKSSQNNLRRAAKRP